MISHNGIQQNTNVREFDRLVTLTLSSVPKNNVASNVTFLIEISLYNILCGEGRPEWYK